LLPVLPTLFDTKYPLWQTIAMCTIGNYIPRVHSTRKAAGFLALLLFCGIFPTKNLCAASTHQKRNSQAFGIAWQVKGPWKSDTQDRIIVSGEAILPGTLVHPVQASGNHSILILLPDGQRILYECFLAEDCAHSFRVPRLYRNPDPFAVDLIARIHQVLSRRENAQDLFQKRSLPQDEVLTSLGPSNQVEIEGLAAALPDGDYTYDLRPLDKEFPRRSGVAFKKTSHSISLQLQSSGIYDITIFDRLGTPRIDLFVAVANPKHMAAFSGAFTKAHELMADWNEDYQGWPIHEFQRAYLESLFLDINPAIGFVEQARSTTPLITMDGTAEPTFSPLPGIFKGDTAVTLTCKTPHAVMHYTINGSQPLNSSPIYRAPIMVTGTALTIKAFASAPGKKDSPVVTGIFRIGD
jgi:hypothetical protein